MTCTDHRLRYNTSNCTNPFPPEKRGDFSFRDSITVTATGRVSSTGEPDRGERGNPRVPEESLPLSTVCFLNFCFLPTLHCSPYLKALRSSRVYLCFPFTLFSLFYFMHMTRFVLTMVHFVHSIPTTSIVSE